MADHAPIPAAPNAQPYVGLVETTVQALRLAYAAHQGVIPRIVRRLNDAERREMIKSGAVFVFSVDESQIRRWTDSRLWSPSRIVGNFLVYREVYERVGTRNQRNPSSSPVDRTVAGRNQWSTEQDDANENGYGAGTNYDAVKPDGLLKKTITVTIGPSDLHVVSYYTQEDIRLNTLPKLSSRQDIMELDLDPSVFRFSSFRNPPKVEAGRNGQLRIICEPEDNALVEPPRPRQNRPPNYNGTAYDPDADRAEMSLSPPIRSRSRFGTHHEQTDPVTGPGRWRSASDAPHPPGSSQNPISGSAWPNTSSRQRSSTGDYFQSNSANGALPLSTSSSSPSISPPWSPSMPNSSSRYAPNSTISPAPSGYWPYPSSQQRNGARNMSYPNAEGNSHLYTLENEYLPHGSDPSWAPGGGRASGPPLPPLGNNGDHYSHTNTASSRYSRPESFASYGAQS